MFPGGEQALTPAILALCALQRNGTGGPWGAVFRGPCSRDSEGTNSDSQDWLSH